MRFFHCEPFVVPIEPSIATIGNFDGMHLGHQAILQQLKNLAHEQSLAATVILFEPQPQEFFQQQNAPARLQRISDKISFLKNFGIDQVICLPFNARLANYSPEDFVSKILINKFNIKAILVGEDFRFGKNRGGDVAYLQNASTLDVHLLADYCIDDNRISSTQIRQLLFENKFDDAAALLGRPFAISGKVVHGAKRGRQLQFPTANIPLHRHKSPLHGVYAVKVRLPSGQEVFGVANVGCRPTIDQNNYWFLEVYLLETSDWDLYGQRLCVEPVQKIRNEMRFSSFEELKSQIAQDVKTAHQLFGL